MTTPTVDAPKRFFIRTLGCPKNEVDTDGMAGLLLATGHIPVADPEEADVVIVNTCGFIERAKQESIDALFEQIAARAPGQRVIAAGCLVQRYRTELAVEIPELDGLVGTREWDRIAAAVSPAPTPLSAPVLPVLAAGPSYPRDVVPYRIAPTRAVPGLRRGSAYLKIADGCSRPCAFCIIPAIKGGFNSKPMEQIVAEARALAGAGVKEVVLVAQDLTAYGVDLGERDVLPDLITAILHAAPSLRWVRLMYAFPGAVSERLIRLMADCPQVLPYLDIPLQHGHSETLRRMRRPGLLVTERLLERLRSAVPDVAIRTAFIVGFPGETEVEFNALVEFVKRHRFDRVGVFTYSREEGTPGAKLPGQVAERVKRRRREVLMQVQQEVSAELNRRFVGQVLEVLIEERVERAPQTRPSAGFRRSGFAELPFDAIGRSYRDAPEVDGVVLCRGDARPGDLVRVQITEALAYDLVGSIVT